YTTNQGGNSVSVIDLATFLQTALIPLSDGGFNLIMNASGSRLYVTTAGGTLYVIDPVTRGTITTLAVGAAANGFVFSPDGATLYVSSRDAGTVIAVATATNTATRTYAVGNAPQRLAISPDGGELYVATEGVGVSIVNVSSGAITQVPMVTGGYGIGLTPDGTQLFVTSPLNGSITVLDRTSHATVLTYTNFGRPRNVAFRAGTCTAIVSDENGQIIFLR
ncbi:MAG: hypothetical protein M3081_05540, partial [Gemmatimonadota bacterium]|nr:hypothetical protein [Gemmatimonadota bacterium]